jgi:DNA-directed RNA polymerase beta' subunit
MMGYRVLFSKNRTVGLHSSYTTPHNADFDGDAGNILKLQTLGARAEMRYVADVGSCIMNATSNKPSMGLVFNSLSSAYMLTNDDFKVTFSDSEWEAGKRSFLSRKIDEEDFSFRLKRHNIPARSGKALFSLLLPPDFYYHYEGVLIKNGILLQGKIGKKHIGVKNSNTIIHVLMKDYGKERTCQFFTEGQYLLNWFIHSHGLSIGYSSCRIENAKELKKETDKKHQIVQKNISLYMKGYEEKSGNEKRDLDVKIQNELDVLKKIGLDIAETYLPNGAHNPINIMLQSGAKGSESNTAQMVGLLGQQFINGSLPEKNLSEGTRCLCYFPPSSDKIEARGFIRNSFQEGLNPAEMYFHMLASRVGIIDKAIKTADTGHIHHKINKVLEDVFVTSDGSVRNVNGTVFQYALEDGFCPSEMISTSSISLGPNVSFVDVASVVGKINAKHELKSE